MRRYCPDMTYDAQCSVLNRPDPDVIPNTANNLEEMKAGPRVKELDGGSAL